MGEDSIVRLCTSAFTSEEIQTSKSLLFESLPTNKRKVQRKGDGKGQRDINDIVQLMKTTDPDVIPIFVARELEKLPPVTFDHLDCTKLLKDLVRLQADIDTVKTNYATLNDLEVLKSELLPINSESPPARLSVCKVNNRRGAWCMDSGPVGLSHSSHIQETSGRVSDPSVKEHTLSFIQTDENQKSTSMELASDQSTSQCVAGDKTTAVPGPAGAGASGDMSHSGEQLFELEPASTSKGKISSECAEKQCDLQLTEQNRQNYIRRDDDGYETVTYKKKKANYRYRGQFGVANDSNTKFKAAERKTPVFISNVHKDTQEKDIIEYIMVKTKEKVFLEKIDIKRDTGHKAYKFFVSPNKLSLFLDKNIWPQGIIFRKFVHFQYGHAIGTRTENGKHDIINK
ncbi:uncharacterized protein LOC133521823 [Cydia pomonella]|uniref:uncharacterized protein LOC133521823 n=1 Tax=Cydia pomonella TaxID=82600 RepID=UPI002ADD5626|nr:uncharacterized protein LOC133521823 [Cydia pomonella]